MKLRFFCKRHSSRLNIVRRLLSPTLELTEHFFYGSDFVIVFVVATVTFTSRIATLSIHEATAPTQSIIIISNGRCESKNGHLRNCYITILRYIVNNLKGC